LPRGGHAASISGLLSRVLALFGTALAVLLCGSLTLVHAHAAAARGGLDKIEHVIVLMQENRSFDSYFGTFPGADGIPPHACVPNGLGTCVRPFHDPRDLDSGGAHGPLAGIRAYVLQDHLFESNWGWSLPAHLWLVSGWSARCSRPSVPSSCTSNLDGPTNGPSSTLRSHPHGPIYAWTDLTYLLHANHVSWAY
jgi:phospholipase C